MGQVLEGMERSLDNAPAVRWPMSVPDGHLSPYHQCPATSQTVSVLAQQVLAWLLRWDPRLQYTSAEPVHVLLPLHRQYHGPLVYQVTVRTKFRCHCRERPQMQRLVVVCTCLGPVPEQWNVVQAGADWMVLSDAHYSTAPLAGSG